MGEGRRRGGGRKREGRTRERDVGRGNWCVCVRERKREREREEEREHTCIIIFIGLPHAKIRLLLNYPCVVDVLSIWDQLFDDKILFSRKHESLHKAFIARAPRHWGVLVAHSTAASVCMYVCMYVMSYS